MNQEDTPNPNQPKQEEGEYTCSITPSGNTDVRNDNCPVHGTDQPQQGQKSEVAQLLARISSEYDAARAGLSGLSQGSSQHRFITRRTEIIADVHTELQQLVDDQYHQSCFIHWAIFVFLNITPLYIKNTCKFPKNTLY